MKKHHYGVWGIFASHCAENCQSNQAKLYTKKWKTMQRHAEAKRRFENLYVLI